MQRCVEKCFFFFFFFFCSSVSFLNLVCTTQAYSTKLLVLEKGKYSAVFAFGDSILDTGSNNKLFTTAKCNFSPYGRDFLQASPTGRFSNGRIPSDFFAEALGIKEIMPSYHDPNLKSRDLETGLSFASGGSGYDPITHSLQNVYSLSDQLRFFKEYIVRLKGAVGEERSKSIIENSVFLISGGNNDITLSYFTTGLRKIKFDVPSYTTQLTNWTSAFFQDLYELGARKFAVLSTIPLGYLPFSRTTAGGPLREAPSTYNEAAQMFNAKLSNELDRLNLKFPKANVVFVDIYNPLFRLTQDPQKFGFEVVDRGCCGTGIIEVQLFCNKLEPSTCTNTSEYIFFDSVHPTEKAYKIALSQILRL